MLPQRYGVFQHVEGKERGAGMLDARREHACAKRGSAGAIRGRRRQMNVWNRSLGPSLVSAGYGRTTLFASTPIFSTSASMRSPALRKLPVAAPTPSGVPVAMMSPGSTVMPRERTSMH